MNTSDTDLYLPIASRPRLDQSARWLLLTASLVSLALWFIPGAQMVLYPIRLFVTFIHEGSHALMTLLTGGSVVGMAVHQDTSGVTTSMGGFRPLVLMAGYLGATAFGAACLQISRKQGNGRRGLLLMAAVTLIITGLWIRPWAEGGFGFLMGMLIGFGLAAGSRFLKEPQAAFLTAFLSVQLCLNALFDMRELVWLTTHTAMDNDAVFMAQAYGLTPWFWALLWSAGALAILGLSLRAFWRGTVPNGAKM